MDNNSAVSNGRFKVGEASWDENLGGFKKDEQKQLFLRLNEGANNVVRIFTNPYRFYAHKVKIHEDEKGYGNRVMCAAAGGDECEACKYNKPQQRWLVAAIDRQTNSVKLVDINYFMYTDISTLSKSAWGSVKNYDLTVVIDRNAATPASYAKCLPNPPTPLSASDQSLIDKFDINDLLKKIKPATAKQVSDRLSFLKENFYSKNPNASRDREIVPGASASTKKVAQKPTVKVQPVQPDEDEDFQNYEEESPF
jgi:hypothetical protein